MCRKFIESIPLDTKGKEIPVSKGAEAICESHIRPFATGRKSWLFADTYQGANASAVAYTLAESAKENGLNVYEYFRHILTKMPNVDFYNHLEEIEKILPWSDELPEICRLAQKNKKHLEKWVYGHQHVRQFRTRFT